MNAMVSARVPVELRDQVNALLREKGSTPTELINRAYRLFLETKELPGSPEHTAPGRRTPTAFELRELQESVRSTTYGVPESFFANRSYDDILAAELEADYAALA